jgi:N-acetylglucosaminyldiphosphoundecaprenol N-acetyl-beta-D-mannosaminyltransferase
MVDLVPSPHHPAGDLRSPALAVPTIELDGVPIHVLNESTAVSLILDAVARSLGGWAITYNVDILRRFSKDAAFAALAKHATLNLADGMPLVWAARLSGTRLPGRVCGSDLVGSLAAGAARSGRSIFLVGGSPGTADKSAAVLRQRWPSLEVAGVVCPAYGFERDPAQLAALEEAVAAARPDIVFVALGSPKQEQVIHRLRRRLPDAWYLGVGGAFSFLAGDFPRAPGWMRTLGLEWFHRLLQEPGRLFHRYLVDDAPYAAGLLLRAAGSRLTRPRNHPVRPNAQGD